MRLTQWDRDVIALWADIGHVPEGHTERQAALAILQRALAEVDEMRATFDELAAHNFITVGGPAWQTEALF